MHGAYLSGLREAGRIHYAFARARHGLPPRVRGADLLFSGTRAVARTHYDCICKWCTQLPFHTTKHSFE